ncbi:MAG TPA: hypothetical protein VGN09_29615 [Vicinamibacteria bacterium]
MRTGALFALLLLSVGAAHAQTWLPSKGQGNVTFTYQDVLARGHLLPNGQRAPGAAGHDPVRSHMLMPEVEYGLSDRLALDLSLPLVEARYGGPNPHRIGAHGQPNTLDDGTYHGGFQDVRFDLRFAAVSGGFAVTPFVAGILPSHHYESRAHSAIGLDLRAFVFGVGLGAFLDAIVPRTYIQAQVSHAVPQKVAGIRPRRSRLDSEVGHFVTSRLALRALGSLQITHDGLDFPYAGLPQDLSLNHDRLSRNNFLNLGGGVSFAATRRLDAFVLASTLVWGENVHPHRGISAGLNWRFSTSRPPDTNRRRPAPR